MEPTLGPIARRASLRPGRTLVVKIVAGLCMATAAFAAVALILSAFGRDEAIVGGGTGPKLQLAADALGLAAVFMLAPWRMFMLRRWAAVFTFFGAASVCALMLCAAFANPYAWDLNAMVILFGAFAAAVVLMGTLLFAWGDLRPGL